MGARDDSMWHFGPQLLEALTLVILDRFNVVHDWMNDFKAEVAAATSLADLQSRIAGLPNMPELDASQIIPALQAKWDETPKYDWMD